MSPNPRRRSFPEQLRGCVAQPSALRLPWRIVLQSWRPKSSAKFKAVAVLLFQGGERGCSDQPDCEATSVLFMPLI
jgi:hypothetical protein